MEKMSLYEKLELEGAYFKLGLVEGRHPLPVQDYIFREGDITFPINQEELQRIIAERFEELGLPSMGKILQIYVTGLTPATTAVIRFAFLHYYYLTIMIYDRDSDSWIYEPIFTDKEDRSFDAGFPAWG